jgi:hypothetical protein
MYKTCKSYSDQAARVAELAEACISLKRHLGYSDADARTVALDNITSIARSGQMVLNLLDSWCIGDQAVRQIIPQLIGLTTISKEHVNLAGDCLNKTSKLALVVLAQFQIENILRNIHRETNGETKRTGFYRCAEDVLGRLGLPPDLMEILNTPARIRNSLHNNGIHHRQHRSEKPIVVVRGVTYEFIDGQKVACASWEHIAHALEASVGVLGEIFNHPQIVAIPDPMMDQYAWEEATKP